MKHHAACWCPRTDTHARSLNTHRSCQPPTRSHTPTSNIISHTYSTHAVRPKQHSHFILRKSIMHTCQLQAPSRRHKQRTNGIKPSTQHFHQHKTAALRLFLKVWGVSSLKRRTSFACDISVQNVLFISHMQYNLTRWNAAAVPCYLN